MVDTGYWYAICDPRAMNHQAAATRFTEFERHGIILPWPCLYETLRTMSLADMVMRLMLEDVNIRVNGLLTFNRKDFHDVCRKRGLEML
jgi:predicted nucleic acid-binding protein